MANKFTDGSLSSPYKNLIGWLINAKRIVLFNQASFTSEFDQSAQCYAFILSSLIGQDNFETKRIRYSVYLKFSENTLVFFYLVLPNPVNSNLNWSAFENENSGFICLK